MRLLQLPFDAYLLFLSFVGLAGPAMLFAFHRSLPRRVEGLVDVVKGAALMVLACFALGMTSQVDLDRTSPSVLMATFMGCFVLVLACMSWYAGLCRMVGYPHIRNTTRWLFVWYSMGLLALMLLGRSDALLLSYNAAACAFALGGCAHVVFRTKTGPKVQNWLRLTFLVAVALFSAQSVGFLQVAFGMYYLSAQVGLVALIALYLTIQMVMVGVAILVSHRLQSQFEREATVDFLSGLLRRNEFVRRAQQETQRCAREKLPAACLMLDIDFFKKINDTHGHQVGDKVIADFGRMLVAACRQYDVVGRYGGEEFVAFLPGASPRDARAIAERIRQSAQEHTTPGLPAYTVSVGVCCASMVPLEDLIFLADKALYRAKHDGRNKVCVEPVLLAKPKPSAFRSEPEPAASSS